MMSATLETLRRARWLIEEPDRWTKGEAARDGAGRAVPHDSPSAVCWCVDGALALAGASVDPMNPACYVAAISHLRDVVGTNVAGWNDHRELTHAQMLSAIDRAIGELEAVAP